jgi:predicted lipid-binding transport protein (Tim44 family)
LTEEYSAKKKTYPRATAIVGGLIAGVVAGLIAYLIAGLVGFIITFIIGAITGSRATLLANRAREQSS